MKADRHAQSSWAHFQRVRNDATTPEREVGAYTAFLRAVLKHAPSDVARRAAREHNDATLALAIRVREETLAANRDATVTRIRHTG
jgi:hypothetical protein